MAMRDRLIAWGVGSNSTAICGGARGADILFAETCFKLGAAVRIHLALPMERFIEKSVRIPNTEWEERFKALLPVCTVFEPDGTDGDGGGVFEKANRRMLSDAEQSALGYGFLAVLVWDENRDAAKAGGTADFFRELEQRALETFIINPTKMEA